ncbi:MAG: glycosyltransferase family 4 protein [Acidobacteriota bacterium]|nr:glycosyltransferase family 4 protein [Acidobacteriota bacterium]
MNIALDATPLTEPTGGISRYTTELSRALAEQFPDDNYWLVSDQPFRAPAARSENLRCGAGPQSAIERRWWLWGLQREMSRLDINLFHGTGFSVPYLPMRRSVLTLHDLSPWADSAWHSSADRVRRRTPLLLRLGLAKFVITPSEAIRKQALERFRLSPERVVAIPEAASALFRSVPAPPSSTPYFLYVGTLEPRKNVRVLIEAWRQVRQRHPVDLVLAGRCRDDFQLPEVEPGLQILGAVPDARLPELFSGALAVAYPSLYEGFGLPVLEAMQCGAAVFTSLDPAISETAGGAAVQMHATDATAWAEALTAAVEQPHWIASLREKSLARARDFSWARTAALTHEVYLEAS